jgi:hypothetical protein
MKKYVSVNAKYYKHSKSSGEIGHVIRQFADNKNSIEHLTSENFGSFKLYSKSLLSRSLKTKKA